MSRHRTLDAYILGTWVRIFFLTALGFPLISILISITDDLRKLLNNGLGWGQILLSYVYTVPENMYQVMPAAVLFATVFTIGNMGRHSEVTAAKAGGISFHRLALPTFVAGLLATGLAGVVGELSPGATAKSIKLQEGEQRAPAKLRYNFVYRADEGWTYTVHALDLTNRSLRQAIFERPGAGRDYPGLAVSADSATFLDSLGSWRLWHGTSRIVVDGRLLGVIDFRSMRLAALKEAPADLLIEPKDPGEMRYAELGRYIRALQRSGNDTNKLEVKQALKLALPGACLIIALFAAPLAVTSARAGTAFGIAVGLGTTVAYLLLIQISEAFGAGGAINPALAAWLPNIFFFGMGVVLLWRVRT